MCSGKIVIGTMVIMLLAFCPLLVATKASAAGCGKWEGIPTITLRVPGKEAPKSTEEAASAESVETCAFEQNVTITFGDVEKFHGHVCPGIALGYRAVQVALGHLYPGEIPPRGDQFVVCGIPRACPADAISYITGARYGKGSEEIFNGNLAFDKTIGDSCYIFADMTNGKAIKLTSIFLSPKKMQELRAKKDTDPEAHEKYEALSHCVTVKILTAPEKDVFTVTPMENWSWKECKERYSR